MRVDLFHYPQSSDHAIRVFRHMSGESFENLVKSFLKKRAKGLARIFSLHAYTTRYTDFHLVVIDDNRVAGYVVSELGRSD
jgi:hypothetical protein